MVATVDLKVGPVLSYRGMTEREGKVVWKVSALIGVAEGQKAPSLIFNNKLSEPQLLAQRSGVTLWRYDLSAPLTDTEQRLSYSIEGTDLSWEFTVPAQKLSVRTAYVSCNGFSDPKAMRRLVHKAGAVWQDLIANHDRTLHPSTTVDKEQLWHLQRGHGTDVQRFHVLMMGGDQIYFDSIWDDIPELKAWADMDRDDQITYKVPDELRQRISDYYFTLYCDRWLRPGRAGWTRQTAERDSADAMARIPTVMMWDDHDIFDGWGSYTPEMQNCEVAQTLFKAAREAFWVYQLQHRLDQLPALQPASNTFHAVDAPQFAPVTWSSQLKSDPLALALLDGQPGFSSTVNLGKMAALVLDLRSERSRRQILSELTWEAAEKWLNAFNAGTGSHQPVKHLLVLSSVPVAHPKLSAAEALLDTFGSEHVVESNADDLKDHWSHDDHEPERKRLTRLLVKTARDKRVRVAVVSGDVHVAACGNLYRKDVTPDKNWLRIQQFTSSAVLHPAPVGPVESLFIKLMNAMAQKVQQIDAEHLCEMVLFPAHNKYVMAARNWLALEPDADYDEAQGPRLWATWRCEGGQGFSNHLLAVHPAPVGA